jgi:hypothetical protein
MNLAHGNANAAARMRGDMDFFGAAYRPGGDANFGFGWDVSHFITPMVSEQERRG